MILKRQCNSAIVPPKRREKDREDEPLDSDYDPLDPQQAPVPEHEPRTDEDDRPAPPKRL